MKKWAKHNRPYQVYWHEPKTNINLHYKQVIGVCQGRYVPDLRLNKAGHYKLRAHEQRLIDWRTDGQSSLKSRVQATIMSFLQAKYYKEPVALIWTNDNIHTTSLISKVELSVANYQLSQKRCSEKKINKSKNKNESQRYQREPNILS